MEFRILGPLEVVEDGNPIALGTLKERLVLGVLLLHANEFVSRERLIDDLWGEAPPATAHKAVNVYLSKVRKALSVGGADPITTASGGYRLHVEPEGLDASRMQVLLAEARERVAEGQLESGAERFQEALSLWRGPTLAGLELESRGREEVAAFDELRLTALMDRIDCDLALCRQERVLGELGVLVREHPLRERLRAQQMLALYRADRQVEALDAYAEARRKLVDDLGIEPSEALQRLQQAILRHDRSLETPEGTTAVNGLAPSPAAPTSTPTDDVDVGERPRRFRPRRWQLAFATLVFLAAAAAAVAVFSTSSAEMPHVVPDSLVRLNPRTGQPTLVVPVGVVPGPIAATPSTIWTVHYGDPEGSDNTVSRYDLRTHRVQTRRTFRYQPYDVAADANGGVWLSGYETPIVTRLAPRAGGTSLGPLKPSKTETIRLLGPAVGQEAFGAGYLWAIVGGYTAPGEDDRLSVIDLANNQVIDSIRLGHATTALAFGDGAAWVGAWINESKGTYAGLTGPSWLYEIRAGDPGGQPFLDRLPLRRLLASGETWGPLSISVGEGAVWVLMCGTCSLGGENRMLLKVDPDTRQVLKRIPLLRGTSGPVRETQTVAAGAGSVWVSGPDGTVWQLDPKSGRILRAIHVGNQDAITCGITATNDAVWVAIGDANC